MFEDMFQADIGLDTACSTSSTFMTYTETSNSNNKRNSTEMNYGKLDDSPDFNVNYQNFCFGVSIYILHFT